MEDSDNSGTDSDSSNEVENAYLSNETKGGPRPSRKYNTFTSSSGQGTKTMEVATIETPEINECDEVDDSDASRHAEYISRNSNPTTNYLDNLLSLPPSPSPLLQDCPDDWNQATNLAAPHQVLATSINEALKRALAEADVAGVGDEEPEVLPHPDEPSGDEGEQAEEEDGELEEKGSELLDCGNKVVAGESGPSKRQGRRQVQSVGSDMKRSRRDPVEIEAEAKRIAIMEEERRVAAMSFDANALAPLDPNMLTQAKYIPLRLTYDERKSLRMVTAAISVSDYTNAVDIQHKNSARRRHAQLSQIVAFLTSLVTGMSFEAGQSVLESRNFSEHEAMLGQMLEAARRYKITNPEKMRSEYGKLVYLLQDSVDPQLQPFLGVNVNMPVRTVYTLCEQKKGLALLEDPLLATATNEVLPDGRLQALHNLEIKRKEKAVERLVRKYAKPADIYSSYSNATYYSSSHYSRSSWNSNIGAWDHKDHAYDDKKIPTELSEDEVRLCLYSISDSKSFLNSNLKPIQECLVLLDKYFKPLVVQSDDGSCSNSGNDGSVDEEKSPPNSFSPTTAAMCPDSSLAIDSGLDGARLSHGHEMQYNYVKQSLTLWAAIVQDMFRLWYLAEQDLLQPDIPYDLRNTGQGLQRVQSSPQVYRAMHEILARTKQSLGSWVGSSVIHLGDHNVPNALVFIDKYTQVAQILGPLIATLKNIERACQDDEGLAGYMEVYGGVEKAKKVILRDFFMHAFDGSGGNNDFDAGSCIDGRLTSAWNWCSQIANKPYYALFRLTGFLSFDGEFDK